jgi:ABC-type lipoprotein release transport system permease subunit
MGQSRFCRSSICSGVNDSGRLVGLAGGIAAALAGGHFIRSLLFGVGTTDPRAFAVVIIVVMTVGLLACYLPTRCAMRVDSMVALRYE